MAKFKYIPRAFLFNKLMGFWGNMVKNYRNDVQDDDFFDILRNCFDHDKAVELVEAAYTPAEIKAMGESRSRRSRLDLDDPLDDLFQCLWNHEKGRGKCRAVLQAIKDYMVADTPKTKDETLEKRFLEIKRVLKLTDLEFDVLLVAYVRSQTCFSWPCRVEDRDKPLYFAMALDRSYGEVLSVMNAKGKLRKFNLLDDDWDFNCRTIGGYLDEIDGLVQSRDNAHASWEVTQVNELLQQMENFDGVMVAATNFCKNLDPAIMRRFTFKLEFDYLDDAGKKSFFERMFKTELTDAEFDDLKAIRNLAPGDFRTVRQETFYIDEGQTNAGLIEALREECRVKKDGDKTAKIGFGA